jgi:NAD(P)-dependent dehydrogenase (short-subunit alcohol dehydrogenase family)
MSVMALSEQTFLVTGASSGIGRETARALARRGARVVLVSRGSGAGAAVTETLRKESGNDELHFLGADLSSLAEVRRVAAEFGARFGQLDVLVNNAGAFFSSRTLTADGFETTFSLNHLSYFLLTHLLLGALLQSPAPRIVNVASAAERFGRLHDDPMLSRGYGGWRAYAQSKLANLLFSYRLARVLAATPVTVNALHPGTVATGFGSGGSASSLLLKLARPFLKTPAQGAQTAIYLAASPDVAGVSGGYFIGENPARSSARSHDQGAQARLWRLSRELVGLSEAEAAPLKQAVPAHERIDL